MDIENILDNIDQYEDNIDDLVKSLKMVGVLSFEDFKRAAQETGVAVKKTIQNAVQQKFAGAEDDDWNATLLQNTTEAYSDFMDKYPDGKYISAAREKIAAIMMEEQENSAKEAWSVLDKKDADAVENYIRMNPSSPYAAEAKRYLNDLLNKVTIEDLKKEIRRLRYEKSAVVYEKIRSALDAGHVSTDEFLDALRVNKNLIGLSVVRSLLNGNYISRSDLRDKACVPEDVIAKVFAGNDALNMLGNIETVASSVTLNPCTEVYFWGIPSSGKTCAMGAILSTVKDGVIVNSCEFLNDCQGYRYMTYLAGGFKQGAVKALPPGTGIGATYEMGMNLRNAKRDTYPVTCIDLAGETINSMFKSDAGMELTEIQANTLVAVKNILCDNRTKNRKKHFFVIEYGAENRTYDGRDQDECLRGAVNYIKSSGIFKNDTDGVYILITKVDETGLKGEALKEKLRDYIRTYYQGFYNNLKTMCEDYEINGGEVLVQPFSLGEVFFNYYCRFDNSYAAEIADILMSGYVIPHDNKFWRFLKR